MEFTKRDTKILKGFAICLMLCHHLFTFPEKLVGVGFVSLPFIEGMSFAARAGEFGKICVALFTLLGGYGAYVSAARSEKSDAQLISRHLVSLYSTFWKVFIIAVPISLLLGQPHGSPFLEDLIYSFLGLRFTYCDEWWFITPFAFLTILSPLIRRFADRRGGSFISSLLWLACLSAVIYYLLPAIMRTPLLYDFSQTFFWIESYTVMTLVPAYAMGCLLARYDLLGRFKALCMGARKAPLILGALAILAVLFYIHIYTWQLYDFINAALFICCVLVLLSTRLGRAVAPLFEKLGEESTFMWLTHTLLCYHWCPRLVYAPKFAPLIFVWLVILSYSFARLIRLFYSLLSLTYAKLTARRAA